MARNKAYTLQAWAYALRDIARLLFNSVTDRWPRHLHMGVIYM